MRYSNIIFLIILILCSLVNKIENSRSTKIIRDTLSFDLDFEQFNFIEVHGERNIGSRNSIKSQLQRKTKDCNILLRA